MAMQKADKEQKMNTAHQLLLCQHYQQLSDPRDPEPCSFSAHLAQHYLVRRNGRYKNSWFLFLF
jgi:hypothetical protein